MQVPVFAFLFRFAGVFEPLQQGCQSDQAGFKTLRKYPAFPVSVFLIETTDMVYESETPHLGADGFEGAMTKFVFVRNGFQGGQKLIGGPFKFHKDREEHLLLGFVMGKKRYGQFVQSFHAADGAVIEVYFGVGCHVAF